MKLSADDLLKLYRLMGAYLPKVEEIAAKARELVKW